VDGIDIYGVIFEVRKVQSAELLPGRKEQGMNLEGVVDESPGRQR
jgi:hypothetical protein